MITYAEYFGKWLGCEDATEERKTNAIRLLTAVSQLGLLAIADGISFPLNPSTRSRVSGTEYGGFRPQSCPIGAPHSAHKEALAVDLYDPRGSIDEWCLDNQDKLEQCGIYIENPNKTIGWSHWSTRRPFSGKRVFNP